jgi:hypothetical protein
MTTADKKTDPGLISKAGSLLTTLGSFLADAYDGKSPKHPWEFPRSTDAGFEHARSQAIALTWLYLQDPPGTMAGRQEVERAVERAFGLTLRREWDASPRLTPGSPPMRVRPAH